MNDETLLAMAEYVERLVIARWDTLSMRQFCTASFIEANAGDANLSQISFPDGTTAQRVPKLAGVTMTAGDQVVCISPGGGLPMIIIGVLVGRIY